MMEWINMISNTDSEIQDICVGESSLTVHVKLWNGTIRQVVFTDYYIYKDKRAIGEEIGDVIVDTKSALMDELKQDTLDGGGTLEEIADVKSIVFYNAWNDMVVLEVLAEEIEFL